MELTKETLKKWLDDHPAISSRIICSEAGINTEAILYLYNAKNRNLTKRMKAKLLPILEKYGFGLENKVKFVTQTPDN